MALMIPGLQEYGQRFVTYMCSDSNEGRNGRRLVGGLVAGVVFTKGSLTVYRRFKNYRLRTEKAEMCKKSKHDLEILVGQPNDATENITSLGITELVEKLQNDELKPSEVLAAFQCKALDVDKKLNCITEPILVAKSQVLDIESTTKAKRPLHGIPISVKDNIGVKGYDCTKGMSCYINHPMVQDSAIVQVLKWQGAIPFVKTNVPQTLLSYMCSNPIFGSTKNPYKLTHTPGGSSGGEAALIAGGGSLLGIGTDVAGSIRIPAHMCGVCGFKPTDGRLRNTGCEGGWKNYILFKPAIGFLSKDVDGLLLAMRAVLVPMLFEIDPEVVPMPFNEPIFESTHSLRIGYYTYDGLIQATPACVRAVEVVKNILEQKGHKLIPWTPPRVDYGFNLVTNGLVGDNSETLLGALADDQIDTYLIPMYRSLRLPVRLRRVLGLIVGLFSEKLGCLLKAGTEVQTVHEWWKLVRAKNDYVEEFANHWTNNSLDAVICPGYCTPALPYGIPVSYTATYTAVYNLVNFPVGTVPVTKVNADDQKILEESYPATDMIHSIIKKLCKDTEGLPVGVQVVSSPWKEELVLRLMKEIEEEMKS